MRFAWTAPILLLAAIVMFPPHPVFGQAPEVWEYSPYRVRVWLSMSPTLGLSDDTKQQIQRRIQECAEVEFGATWSVDVLETPDALFGSVLYHLDDLTIEQLLSRELVLVLSKSEQAKDAFLATQPKKVIDPAEAEARKKMKPEQLAALKTKEDAELRASSLNSIRTLESAIERIPKIAIHPMPFNALQRDIVPFLGEERWKTLQSKLDPSQSSVAEMMEDLKTGNLFAALVPKNEAPRFKEVARSIPSRFPWQPEAMLRDKDKIFLASVDREGEAIKIRVKELDAFVRRIGLMESLTVQQVDEIPYAVAYLAKRSFTPMVRIEDNDNKTAVLRVRAAGLATDPESPILLGPGDVVAPYIRRDDLNGNPTVLQNLPFTYIALTEQIDGARYYGAIFAASRGALAAAKNRRTKRVGLKVHPHYPGTDLKLGVRLMPGSAVPGAEVFRRTPGDEDLSMEGRSDWRGVIPVGHSSLPTIRYDQPTSSSVETIAQARSTNRPPPADGAAGENTTPAVDLSEEEKQKRKPGEKPPTSSLQLKVPLYLYYIKNGETLLARLPIVTGYHADEKADLPDDRRRLQAEAFLKGLQGEVLDLVVRRKILDARIKRKLEEGNLDEASSLLDELKKVKNYDALAGQIQNIQRRAASTEYGPIPLPVAERIDKMIDTTRILMQKYLQDDIVRGLEVQLIEKKQGK